MNDALSRLIEENGVIAVLRAVEQIASDTSYCMRVELQDKVSAKFWEGVRKRVAAAADWADKTVGG